MESCVSNSADLHLAKTLDALKIKEEGEQRLIAENQDLKAELHQEKNSKQLLLEENRQLKSTQQELCGQMEELKEELRERRESGGGVMGSSRKHCQHCDNIDRELAKLKSANDELRYINDQWDKDYREHQEVFRRFREDSRRAQSESESFIAVLKENKEQLLEQIRDLQYELDRSRKEVQRIQQQQLAGHQNGINPRRLKELEEENAFLRSQLKAYQEDFEAERRDRERINEEKQSATLRFEAEITSLKLQLDRCRNELVHYTTEATRLAQQLRLKNQYEEDQFKKHLESQGYIPRSPNSALPPLDPYVENDPPPPHRRNLAPTSSSNTMIANPNLNGLAPSRRLVPGQFLARSSEDVSKSAPTTTEHRVHPSPPTVQRKSHPPSPTYVNMQDSHQTNQQMQALLPLHTQQPSTNGYIMQNGHIAPTNQGINHHQPSPQPMVNGYSSTSGAQLVNGDGLIRNSDYRYPANFQQLVVGNSSSNNQPHVIPRVESKGKYACPRCARKFNNKADCSDHKARCMS